MVGPTLEYYSPGWWVLIHTAAANIKTPADLAGYNWLIDLTRRQFRCIDCRKHFKRVLFRSPAATVSELAEPRCQLAGSVDLASA